MFREDDAIEARRSAHLDRDSAIEAKSLLTPNASGTTFHAHHNVGPTENQTCQATRAPRIRHTHEE